MGLAKLCFQLVGWLLVWVPTATIAEELERHAVPIEAVDATTRATWLLDGDVYDSETGKRITDFIVTPGSLGTDDKGKSTVRWRDNLKREMEDGRLRWPRTSGFSVMRFRITADGYRPAITHRVWRGGPHSRLSVRLHPVDLNHLPTRESTETTPLVD